jgi:hypothetical protein
VEVGIEVHGSITRNEKLGGFNVAAIQTALQLGARVVVMPTRSAHNYKIRHGDLGGCPERPSSPPRSTPSGHRTEFANPPLHLARKNSLGAKAPTPLPGSTPCMGDNDR